jgi:hypothetical protein
MHQWTEADIRVLTHHEYVNEGEELLIDILAAKHCSVPTRDLKIEFHNQYAVGFQVRTQV